MKAMSAWTALVATTIVMAASAAAADGAEPYSFLGYAIGQKLEACPVGSRVSVSEHRRICGLGAAEFAGTAVTAHAVTLFNKEVIGLNLEFGPLGEEAGAQVLAELQRRFGNPDRAFSQPDLRALVWVRGAVVVHFDSAAGSLAVTDVIKTEVAKLRVAPPNQVDF